MRYLSVCSGIEAASVAWEPLGWTPVGFAEIEAFPSAVLAHHYGSNMPGEPLAKNGVPNYGDFTTIPTGDLGPVDILVGGTPCQAFSFAGKRLSLADARGNLTLAYAVLAHDLADNNGLRNAVWENVPGVLSTPDNAFGCFLSALVGGDVAFDLPRGIDRWPDGGMVSGPRARAAWIVRDAQYFGLAQRRARVFVVVDFGAGADPAAVLFEPKSLSGHSPPRRETRQGAAGHAAAGAGGGGAFGGGNCGGPIDVAATLTAKGQRIDFEVETFVAEVAPTVLRGHSDSGLPCLRAEGGDAGGGSEVLIASPVYAIQERAVCENPNAGPDGLGVQADIAYTLEARQQVRAVAFPANLSGTQCAAELNISPALGAKNPTAVAFDLRGREGGAQFEGPHDTANIRAANGGSSRSYVALPDDQRRWAVRRLTPTECARLQGFDDNRARIPWRGRPAEACPDGPQYKAFGNSMATTVMRWLGERIAAVLRDHGEA